MYKIITSAPKENTEEIIDAMSAAGAGIVGNYSHCALVTEGTGYFKPLAGATPHIGTVGKLEKVKEYKIEMPCEEDSLKAVIKALRQAHPYEEPIIDVYELRDV